MVHHVMRLSGMFVVSVPPPVECHVLPKRVCVSTVKKSRSLWRRWEPHTILTGDQDSQGWTDRVFREGRSAGHLERQLRRRSWRSGDKEEALWIHFCYRGCVCLMLYRVCVFCYTGCVCSVILGVCLLLYRVCVSSVILFVCLLLYRVCVFLNRIKDT